MGTRSALGTIDNIGHKVSAITIDPSKKTNAIKKEILQQQQIVTRQKLCKAKATSSLKDLVETETKSVSCMHDRLNFFQMDCTLISKKFNANKNFKTLYNRNLQ